MGGKPIPVGIGGGGPIVGLGPPRGRAGVADGKAGNPPAGIGPVTFDGIGGGGKTIGCWAAPGPDSGWESGAWYGCITCIR